MINWEPILDVMIKMVFLFPDPKDPALDSPERKYSLTLGHLKLRVIVVSFLFSHRRIGHLSQNLFCMLHGRLIASRDVLFPRFDPVLTFQIAG